MQFIQVDNNKKLEDLYNKILTKCKEESILYNAVFHGQFQYQEVDSIFIQPYKESAKDWQSRIKPENLIFNHGEYINKYYDDYQKSGTDYLVEELLRKKDTNRACWSLIDMDTIIDCGNSPIPSFLAFQVGFPRKKYNNLLVMAYYRALEISKFLPINLAELCEIVKELNNRLVNNLEFFDLTIITFKAYINTKVGCFIKAVLDLLEPQDISIKVFTWDISTIKNWLKDKIKGFDKTIATEGIKNLINSIKVYNKEHSSSPNVKTYPKKIITILTKVLDLIKENNDLKTYTTDPNKIDKIYEEIRENVFSVINLLGD